MQSTERISLLFPSLDKNEVKFALKERNNFAIVRQSQPRKETQVVEICKVPD